ncbi:hypothetical protein CHS0354_030340 [Potamilus streckersoni]|uniref:heparosan-N-sulfate-glucuronate 5-epimerase n=1 Tax=Potamilus streckersoni TaxID=2493646 RepID=A0AAE0T4U2_9BIVA|nr:hypothetical protein CHS0354_030340 [Potamilus streckersoni]
MRVNLRTVFLLLAPCTIIMCFALFTGCARKENVRRSGGVPVAAEDNDTTLRFLNRGVQAFVQDVKVNQYREIECLINTEYTVQCRRDDDDVYMPFSFVQKYFEVYGSIEKVHGYERLEFSYSYSKVSPPINMYSPDGKFMSFEHFNVEMRSRVKCITATEGVPMSTQWNQEGYYYPIQIAQYGLSHYSKYLSEGEPDITILTDGSKQAIADWSVPDDCEVRSVWDKSRGSYVLELSVPDSLKSRGISFKVQENVNFALALNVRFVTNGSISVSIKLDDVTFHINYIFSTTIISRTGRKIFYGMGEKTSKWIHLVRDLDKDLVKGLQLYVPHAQKLKVKANKIKILSMTIRGRGRVDNITLASANHMDHFYDAANWFVNYQDTKRGGWPIMVAREIIPGKMELPPGWYSAMGQGQAMSVLVRAYLRSKSMSYLQAAINGLKVFNISSEQGGVKARFANTYDWYEEYPTTPGSYVLNGFMYSLLGLYDLMQVTEDEPYRNVKMIYDSGMRTLKSLLPLFDSGSGTFYDLRHVTHGIAPNRARWDYHTTHINQVLQFSVIDADPIFRRTATRWIDYMKGKIAPHN